MRLPLQVTFHNVTPTPDVEDLVRDRASRLDRFCDRITSCSVVVDLPHRRHHTGNQYQVRLDITVPGDEIAVSREAPERAAAQDLPAAVSDAFDAAERLLEDYTRRRRE